MIGKGLVIGFVIIASVATIGFNVGELREARKQSERIAQEERGQGLEDDLSFQTYEIMEAQAMADAARTRADAYEREARLEREARQRELLVAGWWDGLEPAVQEALCVVYGADLDLALVAIESSQGGYQVEDREGDVALKIVEECGS